MLLKKQTVWLLTMLSLVVVLSVYYVTSPENASDNLAYEETATEEATEGTEATTTESEEAATEGEEVVVEESTEETAEEGEGTVISSVASDELFTALRLEMDDQRSKLVSDLQAIMASSDVSPEQKSDAYDKMIEVQEVSAKERVLETLIKAESDQYSDVLVRADGESVRIIVKSKDHTPAQANKIIQLVRTELGKKDVAVEFSNK
ncbi:stage III sporulation protein AH [Bacillus mesophilus]|uniref:SpoIIIAH-like family protein n=1 Tax=Bacillus mesophilus TaxID=1808955 RepID=A0A6M0Q5D9_9BACI|nr:SpoIIIAH-like family protein [Bacillus mesophilus]MBM7660893.1 stage III sporulation protein AH [Bacillus mesophilus]NEY71561.1 SpoIIIAH-like family protein [Bacillus mesophilus]